MDDKINLAAKFALLDQPYRPGVVGFDQEHFGLFSRVWAVLDAARDDEQLARVKLDVAVA